MSLNSNLQVSVPCRSVDEGIFSLQCCTHFQESTRVAQKAMSHIYFLGNYLFSMYEIHTAEPLVPEPSVAEVKLAIDTLKSHKSPGIDQIPAELIKAGGRTICLEIHKLITFIWKKEKLPEEQKESIIIPIQKRGIKQIAIIIETYHFCQPLTKFYPTSCCQG